MDAMFGNPYAQQRWQMQEAYQREVLGKCAPREKVYYASLEDLTGIKPTNKKVLLL